MVNFQYPEGANQFDAAAFTQSGEFIKSGHREECEQAAIDAGGLYCWWIDGCPVIRGDFEKVDERPTAIEMEEYAIEHGRYSKIVKGSGWVKCDKNDDGAQPDLNWASEQMCKE